VVEVPQWDDAGDLTPDRLRQKAHASTAATVEEGGLDDLLGAVPQEDEARFAKLRQSIQEQLSGVKVYTVGDEPERQVYVVGKTKDGK
jgi:hypothetical protein